MDQPSESNVEFFDDDDSSSAIPTCLATRGPAIAAAAH
jgi:hypothetical protein